MGQHFVLVVPDSALDPSVAPHPPEDGKVSCILRRLTSDPDIYIMPLDGCGVNQHVRHISVYTTALFTLGIRMHLHILLLSDHL